MILIKTEVVLLGKSQGLLPVTAQSVRVIEEKAWSRHRKTVFANRRQWSSIDERYASLHSELFTHGPHTGQVSFNLI